MFVKLVASVGLLICLALALHMCLGRARQRRLEAWLAGYRDRLFAIGSRRFNSRERRRAAHEAAMDAISRAKRTTDDELWDGNVYRPKEFNGKPPGKPH
ncbi:hypothetical protein [Paucibacter soli]|uniref:hypothetical protein n=1 Tax=Paucibacter soli TaxID=3133433 RepID=UPI0030B11137